MLTPSPSWRESVSEGEGERGTACSLSLEELPNLKELPKEADVEANAEEEAEEEEEAGEAAEAVEEEAAEKEVEPEAEAEEKAGRGKEHAIGGTVEIQVAAQEVSASTPCDAAHALKHASLVSTPQTVTSSAVDELPPYGTPAAAQTAARCGELSDGTPAAAQTAARCGELSDGTPAAAQTAARCGELSTRGAADAAGGTGSACGRSGANHSSMAAEAAAEHPSEGRESILSAFGVRAPLACSDARLPISDATLPLANSGACKTHESPWAEEGGMPSSGGEQVASTAEAPLPTAAVGGDGGEAVGQQPSGAAVDSTTQQSQSPEADGSAPAATDAAADNELIAVQIAAIMAQHAEDSKRMSVSDAGRLAMEALRSINLGGADANSGGSH